MSWDEIPNDQNLDKNLVNLLMKDAYIMYIISHKLQIPVIN